MTTHAAAIERQVLADGLLKCGPWTCCQDDDALCDHARAQARAVAQDAAALDDPAYALQRAARRSERHCIAPPAGVSDSGALARLSCEYWWRRQLRRLNDRRLEQRERVLGRVHKRAGIYVSRQGYRRRQEHKARNLQMLAEMVATNQHGQEYTLAELSELGLSNPDHRRAELMLRIADTEAEAERRGHIGMFYTITCPSRFHAIQSKTATVNRKYRGADPREAQAHLQELWSKARAKLGRDERGIYGIRVVEPHHDGTPHWHLLLWMRAEDEPAVTRTLRRYALATDPGEVAGRESVRFKPVKIDREKGSAAGYVAKYIAKNINGQQFGEVDHYGESLETSAPRIEAWASTWGIRQFQFVGLPSVTVWREMRRLREDVDVESWEAATRPEPEAAAILAELRRACLGGQWDKFLSLMGGPMTPRQDQPVKPWRFEKLDEVGRYGEPVPATYGVVVKSAVGVAEYLTRLYRWSVERKPATDGVDFERIGAAETPWTGVNNCTEPDAAPPRSPQQIWEPWELNADYWYRRMNPAPDPEHVRALRLQIERDAVQYRHESAERIAANQAERHRLRSIREGEDVVIRWLAAGEISMQEAYEVLTA